jgi:glycosyltransferase involved in cell wall biosynthesis
MNIGLDIQATQTEDSRNRGIGNYVTNHINTMLKLDMKNNYTLLRIDKNIDTKLKLNKNSNYENIYIGTKISKNRLFNYTELKDILIKSIVKRAIDLNKLDAIHFTSPFEPWNIFEAHWYKEKGCKLIATVYDLIPLIFKDIYLKDKATRSWYFKRIQFLKQMDNLLVISTSVKDDLIKHLGIEGDKIKVIYSGVSDDFKKVIVSEEEQNFIRKKYGISKDFIMYTGGVDYRKNIEKLIEAFSLMNKNLIDSHNLVIVCKMLDNEVQHYRRFTDKYGVTDKVIFTKYVPFDHLLKLYNMSKAFVFPSLYEGFGLPVIEAMKCGAPVITSKTSSLPEVAGEAAILIDPMNAKSIAEGMSKLLLDKDLRNNLIRKGYEQSKKFTWEKVAKDTLDVYEEIEKEVKLNNRSNHSVSKLQNTNKKYKIAYFSPLNPERSGISDYSEDLLPYLKKYLDIDIYTKSTNIDNVKIKESFKVYKYKDFEKNINKVKYDVLVYQMGNSSFHEEIYELLQKYPGIAVLHDMNLKGFINYLENVKKKENSLRDNLILEYGMEGIEKYKYLRTKYVQDWDIEINRIIGANSIGLIAHSNFVINKMKSKNILLPTAKINQAIPMYEEEVDYEYINSLRKKYNLNIDDIVLSSFGIVAKIKRIDVILKALGSYIKEKKVKNNIKLILAGDVSNEFKEEIETIIDEYNLKDNVILTGYIKMDEFIGLMYLSDICFNLRYPTNGETSASLLRLLSVGKPVFVTEIDAFAEIPDEICIKIYPRDDEVQQIHENLDKLINDRKIRDDIGKRAREYIKKHHSLENAAKAYYDFIDRVIKIEESSKQENKAVLLDKIVSTYKELAGNKMYDLYNELSDIAETISRI